MGLVSFFAKRFDLFFFMISLRNKLTVVFVAVKSANRHLQLNCFSVKLLVAKASDLQLNLSRDVRIFAFVLVYPSPLLGVVDHLGSSISRELKVLFNLHFHLLHYRIPYWSVGRFVHSLDFFLSWDTSRD